MRPLHVIMVDMRGWRSNLGESFPGRAVHVWVARGTEKELQGDLSCIFFPTSSALHGGDQGSRRGRETGTGIGDVQDEISFSGFMLPTTC